MESKLEFEALYNAYELCLKNKKRKYRTYNSLKFLSENFKEL